MPNATDQLISLPNGGGALQGLGETFNASPQSGTGTFTVPLLTPAGRNGLQPALKLTYSTGNGNGPFGLGWELNVPVIARSMSKGLPLYEDQVDIFILSGSEDLVPVAQSPSGTIYRPRTEGIFADIEHQTGASGNRWQVLTKGGLTSIFGSQGDSASAATLVSPADSAKIAAWFITETNDPFGNRMIFEWMRDAGPATRPSTQVYLQRISYIDYIDAASTARFLASVVFTYEDRPDAFSDYRLGFERRTSRRCSQIEVSSDTGTGPQTVRTYQLSYGGSAQSVNHVSLLTEISLTGHNGTSTETLPPLRFSYTNFEPNLRRLVPLTGAGLPTASLANPDYELVDLFGTGLQDILATDGTPRYWRNQGNGSFDLPRSMSDAPANFMLADPSMQLLDADGDGTLDLVVTAPYLAGYYPMTADGGWDRRSFQRYKAAPSFNLKDPQVKLLDLNGDGAMDAILGGRSLEVFFSNPATGWSTTRRVERNNRTGFPEIDFTDPRLKWADMSGDGLQDVLLVANGAVTYWPNLGFGNWGAPVRMRTSPRFPFGFNPARVLVDDIDGDGVADLVYVEDNQVTLWINQSGNGWSDPVVIKGTPSVSDVDSIRLVDLLGTGVAGVLWSAAQTTAARTGMFFLDLTGGHKPYLLASMDNQIGAITHVTYATSTEFYLKDEADPATRWKTRLPFPVQVVARVEMVDAVSGGSLTTLYRYHHGYWDGREREFRGFGMVERTDAESFRSDPATQTPSAITVPAGIQFSPPTCLRSWFHLGPVEDADDGGWTELDYSSEFWNDDPDLLADGSLDAFVRSLPNLTLRRDAWRALRGSLLRSELYATDGSSLAARPYTVVENAYGLRQELTLNADLPGVFFPHPVASRTTQWERGNDPLTRLQFTETHDYDAFGQLLRSTSVACPRGWRGATDRPKAAYLATRSYLTYAISTQAAGGIHDRVCQQTLAELTKTGNLTVSDLRLLDDSDPSIQLRNQTLSYFDGPAFAGLPLGEVGAFGALVRSETLAFTPQILDSAYRSGTTILQPPEEPPYLSTAGAPVWTAEYPAEFQSGLQVLAGYAFYPGGSSLEPCRGYFAQTTRNSYDFQQASANGKVRGLILVRRNALGFDTAVTYDAFGLLVVGVIDAAGLARSAVYDYGLQHPTEVKDENGNFSTFVYSPLGLVTAVFIKGQAGEGDQANPSSTWTYDFQAFAQSRSPISVISVQRVHHDSETDIPLPDRNATIQKCAYSDGFGRVVQTRSQVENLVFGDPVFGGAILPPDQADASATLAAVVGVQRSATAPLNVVVSGWQIYDNKGRVVVSYEPFFSQAFAYNPPLDAQYGSRAIIFYDPRGQVVRSVNPDGTEQQSVFGVPGTIGSPDLSDPNLFEPTPWENYVYDANDNAGRTDPTGSGAYAEQWNTPSSALVDALGRVVATTLRNCDPPVNGIASPSQEIHSATTYDMRGNVLAQIDGLGRTAFTYTPDCLGRIWRTESIDAGITRTVLDASDQAMEQRDTKGALLLTLGDNLQRQTHLWARDSASEPITLRQRLVYGDDPALGLTYAQQLAGNLLGKVCRSYDEAGRINQTAYDFKGNLLDKTRQVIQPALILGIFTPPPTNWNLTSYRVEWAPSGVSDPATLETRAAALLAATTYQTTATYDALNRLKSSLLPQDVSGTRKTLQPVYNQGGDLCQISFDGQIFVSQIAYDAQGRRTLVAFGNGLMTRYANDPRSGRLLRLRSENFIAPDSQTYTPSGDVAQDFAYEYDSVGNLLLLHDRTPGSGVPNTVLGTDALDRSFRYDALYRLLSATGRECDVPPDLPWDDEPRCTDPTLARAYTETYAFDAVDNLLSLGHGATRTYAVDPASNRVTSMKIGQAVYGYTYDTCGNLLSETTSRHFAWDHSNQMRSFAVQAGTSEPSVFAQYLYDVSGQRIMKVVRLQGGDTAWTIYIDGVFEHQYTTSGDTVENNTLHVLDTQARVATVRVGPALPGDTTPPVKYVLADHLGSSNAVFGGSDATGATLINREEFTPYGETSFGSFALKRYRFTARERDEESGLGYHGARYYAPWLARWCCPDPAGPVNGPNLYAYALNNPMGFVDPGGTDGDSVSAGSTMFYGNDVNGQPVYAVGTPASPSAADETGTQAEIGPEAPVENPPEDVYIHGDPKPTAAPSSPTPPADFGAKDEAFATGAVKGAAFAFTLAAFGEVGVVVGAGLLVYGAYKLATGGYKEVASAAGRLASGEGTASDYEAAGGLVGGIAAGGIISAVKASEGSLSDILTALFEDESGGVGGKARAPFDIESYNRQTSKPMGAEPLQAHHPEQQGGLAKAIADYSRRRDLTVDLPRDLHVKTYSAQAAERALPNFLQQLGSAESIGRSSSIMQSAGVPADIANRAALEHAGYLFSLNPTRLTPPHIP